jgi:hypothetical protein
VTAAAKTELDHLTTFGGSAGRPPLRAASNRLRRCNTCLNLCRGGGRPPDGGPRIVTGMSILVFDKGGFCVRFVLLQRHTSWQINVLRANQHGCARPWPRSGSSNCSAPRLCAKRVLHEREDRVRARLGAGRALLRGVRAGERPGCPRNRAKSSALHNRDALAHHRARFARRRRCQGARARWRNVVAGRSPRAAQAAAQDQQPRVSKMHKSGLAARTRCAASWSRSRTAANTESAHAGGRT